MHTGLAQDRESVLPHMLIRRQTRSGLVEYTGQTPNWLGGGEFPEQ